MKILQVIHRIPPSHGGSQFHTYRLSQELVRLGHEVSIATTFSIDPTGDVRGLSVRGVTTGNRYPNGPEMIEQDGVRIFRFHPTYQWFSYLVSFSMKRWLRAHLGEFDVVHAHGYTFSEPHAVLDAARLLGDRRPRLILTGHDLTQPHAQWFYRTMMNFYDRVLTRSVRSQFDAYIALTEDNRLEYRRLGVPPEKIFEIPNGVDYEIFASDAARVRTTPIELLFVGRLVEYKGVQRALEGLALLLPKLPDIHFTIVGEDQGFRGRLEELCQRLGLTNHVTFTGPLSMEELVKVYRRAHYFVLPSTNEGFGLVVLEAIAAGCYPLLADAKALSWILKEIGGTGLPISMMSEVMAQTILNLDEEQREEAVRKMQRIVQRRYTWNAVAQALNSIYA